MPPVPVRRAFQCGFSRLGVQTLLLYLILMWIGGGSQSTAGGIKVNAFAVVVLNLVAVLRGTESGGGVRA